MRLMYGVLVPKSEEGGKMRSDWIFLNWIKKPLYYTTFIPKINSS